MDIKEFIKAQDEYTAAFAAACKELSEITKGNRNAFGLTADAVKASGEYKQAKAARDAAFARLRAFNLSVSGKVKRDAARVRQASRKG